MIGYWISHTSSLVLGYFLPGFLAFKSLQSSNAELKDYWLQYFVVLTFCHVGEFYLESFLSWIPLYYELRLVFISWLAYLRGCEIMYTSYFKPQFYIKYEQDLDACLTNFRYYINQQFTRLFKLGVSWVQEQATGLLVQRSASLSLPEKLMNFFKPTQQSSAVIEPYQTPVSTTPQHMSYNEPVVESLYPNLQNLRIPLPSLPEPKMPVFMPTESLETKKAQEELNGSYEVISLRSEDKENHQPVLLEEREPIHMIPSTTTSIHASQLPKLSKLTKPTKLREVTDPANIKQDVKVPSKDLTLEDKKKMATRSTRLTKPVSTIPAPIATAKITTRRIVNKP